LAVQKDKEESERKKNEVEKEGDAEGDEKEKEKLEGEVQKKSEQSMWQVMQEKTKKLDIGGLFGGDSERGAGAEKTQRDTKQEMK